MNFSKTLHFLYNSLLLIAIYKPTIFVAVAFLEYEIALFCKRTQSLRSFHIADLNTDKLCRSIYLRKVLLKGLCENSCA